MTSRPCASADAPAPFGGLHGPPQSAEGGPGPASGAGRRIDRRRPRPGTVSFPVSITDGLRYRQGRAIAALAHVWPANALDFVPHHRCRATAHRQPVGNTTARPRLGHGAIRTAFERGFHERAIPTVMLPIAVVLMGIALAFFPRIFRRWCRPCSRIASSASTSRRWRWRSTRSPFPAGPQCCIWCSGGKSGNRFSVPPAPRRTLEDLGLHCLCARVPVFTLGIAFGHSGRTLGLATWGLAPQGHFCPAVPLRVCRLPACPWPARLGVGKRAAYLLLRVTRPSCSTYFA